MMEQAAAAGDIDAIVQADVEFHEAVLHIAPQFHTIHIWRSIAPRIRAYFYRHSRERDLDSVVEPSIASFSTRCIKETSSSCSRRSTGTSSCPDSRPRRSRTSPIGSQPTTD